MNQLPSAPVSIGKVSPAGRVALLIDGDNLGVAFAAQLLDHWRPALPAIRRVYADQTRGSSWSAIPELAQIHSGTGKNATDMLIAIDAVELALSGRIDTVALATSDRDFAPLAHWLRERGITVTGFGEAKAPGALRGACTRFHLLESPAPPRPTAPPKPPKDPLVARIAATVATEPKDAGMTLVDLNARLRKAGVNLADTGAASWRAALLRWPDHFALDPKGPAARVRLR